jgi:hypothetical protein
MTKAQLASQECVGKNQLSPTKGQNGGMAVPPF